MKYIFIILLFSINIYANDTSEKNSTCQNYIDNPLQVLLDASAYLDSLNSQENRDKAKEVYEKSTGKVKQVAAKGLAEVYCSVRYRDEIQCRYWSQKAGISHELNTTR